MQKPNLFKYATKELSQDAIICYILEWASEELKEVDSKVHRVGKRLIDGFFNKYRDIEKPEKYSVVIKKQYKNIDVLCIVNDKYYIIIEDKTNTSKHSNQLIEYFKKISKNVPEENILRIYYKTGEEFDVDSLDGYKLFSKIDILEALQGHTDNQIINEYKEHIEQLVKTSNYKNLPINKWDANTWISFTRDLKKNGLNLDGRITHGKGNNKGIYFNYNIIDRDKVGFYLRISFEEMRLEFKLENEGNELTKDVSNRYYQSIINEIDHQNTKAIEIKKAINSPAKQTKIVATIENILSCNGNMVNFEKTKNYIEAIIQLHSKLVTTMNT